MLRFEKIIGHEQVIEHLQNAIRLEKVSHAYLLSGDYYKELLNNSKAIECYLASEQLVKKDNNS